MYRLAPHAGAKRPAPSEDDEPRFESGRALLAAGCAVGSGGPPRLEQPQPEHSTAMGSAAGSSTGSSAESQVGAPQAKKRQRWFDKAGNVVVLRQEATAGMAYWPSLLVITGKKNQGHLRIDGSPRHVLCMPLLVSTDEECYHISQLEPLDQALPRIYHVYASGRGATEGGDLLLLRKIVAAVRKQHERSAQYESIEQAWARLVPGGEPWEQLVAHLAQLEQPAPPEQNEEGGDGLHQ